MKKMTYFFRVAFEWRARYGWNPSSSPHPAGMSGDCLRGYPQPTPLAPAQVWPGLDLGFLVDFYALRYTKTKGVLPTGLTAAKTITEAGFWVRKTGRWSSGTFQPFLAVVLGVETGVDGKQIFVANLLQQYLAPGELHRAHVNPHAPADRPARGTPD